MPQKRLESGKIWEVKELRSKGLTYNQIHRETGVSTGKIAEICEKVRPVTTLNSLDDKLSTLLKSMVELQKQFVAVRDRAIDDAISKEEDFVCPNCTNDFMIFEESKKPFMKCPRCDYVIVFGSL